MNGWWLQLNTRDRRVIQIGVLLIGMMLLWALAWHPLAQARYRLALDLERSEQDLHWMESVAATLRQRQSQGRGNDLERAGRSLLALVDGHARALGLGATFKRAEPSGEGRVNVWFEGVAFDAMIGWAEDLHVRFGIQIEELSVDRAQTQGTVDVRISLQDAR
jgi:general secretion pathway protein M